MTKELCWQDDGRERIALLAAFFLAITPWHLHFSRIAFEMSPYVCMTLLGLWPFLRMQRAQHPTPWLSLAVIGFGLALYAYFTARIFIPALGLFLLGSHYPFFLQHRKATLLAAGLLGLLVLPLLAFQLSPAGWARFAQVSIFAAPPEGQTVWQHIWTNYWSHASLAFLFTRGDTGMPGQPVTRHSVPGFGELLLVQLPPVVIGLAAAPRRPKRYAALLLFWLLVYPTGSMLTTATSAQATRSIIGVIPFSILSALGLNTISHCLPRRRQRVGWLGLAFFVTLNHVAYLDAFFIRYPQQSADFLGWQYGMKALAQTCQDHTEADACFLSYSFNAPETLLRFFQTQLSACPQCQIMDPSLPIDAAPRCLFLLSQDDIIDITDLNPQWTFSTDSTIPFPNGQPAFFVGRWRKLSP